MSGRHRKPTPFALYPTTLKTAGGIIAGAALAGAIAASSAAAAPGIAPRLGAEPAIAELAAVGQDGSLSRHEAHRLHAHIAHRKHAKKAPAKADAGAARSARSRSDRSAERAAADRSGRVSAEQVIKLATSQIGNGEDGSGESKFNKWFVDDPRALTLIKRDGGSLADYKAAAWCDMFVSWVGDKLGLSKSMGFDAYTPEHAKWFEDHGRWGDTPRPGAVAFFSWTGHTINDIDHVGFFIKDNGDGTVETVEGNTDNTVAIRTRAKSNVVGYGYPDYRK
ncbi:MAG TPA: CHAP domain-containing protein [Streptosporangiaceae bacterium]